MAIRVGILGYGNLGRGVELAVSKNEDMELAGIFTRRDPSTEARTAHIAFDPLPDKQAMVAAGTEVHVCKEWRKELRKGHRSPYHEQDKRKKPLQQ